MQSCANCDALVPQSDRYPQYLCGDCEDRAVDADGARVVATLITPVY